MHGRKEHGSSITQYKAFAGASVCKDAHQYNQAGALSGVNHLFDIHTAMAY